MIESTGSSRNVGIVAAYHARGVATVVPSAEAPAVTDVKTVVSRER